MNAISKANDTLREAFVKDHDFAYSWYCNILMPIIDSGCSRVVAEEAAIQIMINCFNFDISKTQLYIARR